MAIPYSFTRREDGPGNTISASHANELQQAIEEVGGFALPPFTTGVRYDASHLMGGQANATVALTADRLYAAPFWIGPNGFTADRIGVTVTTGAAGNARLGVYSNHATEFRPDALIDDSGTVDVSSTGEKTITVDETFTSATPLRFIWLAIVSDVAPTVRAVYGTRALMGMDATNSYQAMYMAHTYGALPTNFSSSPSLSASGAPRIFLRAA